MSSNNPPPNPGASDESGWSGPVAGLARLVDGLRRDIDPLTGLPGRVDELAEVLARLGPTPGTWTQGVITRRSAA